MKDKEFQDLIDQSLNETISEVDMKALEERMLQDPQARIQYLNSVGATPARSTLSRSSSASRS